MNMNSLNAQVRTYYQVQYADGSATFAPDGYSKYYDHKCKYGLEDAREHAAELASKGYNVVVVKITEVSEIVRS